MVLGEFPGHGSTMELVNRLLGQILTPGNVDGLEPTALAPAPRRNGRNADFSQPFRKADDCCV